MPDLRQMILGIRQHRDQTGAMPAGRGFFYPPVTSSDVRHELYLTGFGQSSYAPHEKYPCAGHPHDYHFKWKRGRVLGDFAVVLITNGQGEFEDQPLGRVPFGIGEVLLIPPGVWHRYRPRRNIGWTETWVTMNGEYLYRLRGRRFFPHTCLIRKLADPRFFLRTWRQIQRCSQKQPLAKSALILSLISHALEGHELTHRGVVPPASGNTELDRALEFIESNSHRPINVQSMARELGVARRSLERLFKKNHTRSPAAEIERCRLERAKLLLTEGAMSVKEIGFAAGFSGSKRLIETFHRHHQQTPLGYRRAQSGYRGKTQQID